MNVPELLVAYLKENGVMCGWQGFNTIFLPRGALIHYNESTRKFLWRNYKWTSAFLEEPDCFERILHFAKDPWPQRVEPQWKK